MSRAAFWPMLAMMIALGLWLQTQKNAPDKGANAAPDGAPDPSPTAAPPEPRANAATAVAAHGDVVWMGRQDGTLVEFDQGQVVRVVHAGPIHRLRADATGLFSVSADGSAAWWAPDGMPRARARLGGHHLNDGLPLPDGTALLAADKGMVARSGLGGWRSPGLHGQAAFAVALAPDGREGASGGTDGRVVIFDVATGKANRVLPAAKTWVTAVEWEPQGLYVGDREGNVTFWSDAAGTAPSRVHPRHDAAIVALAIADGRVLSGSADGKGQVSAVEDGRRICRFTSPDGSLLDVTLTAQAALTAHKDGRIRRWGVTDGKLVGTLPAD